MKKKNVLLLLIILLIFISGCVENDNQPKHPNQSTIPEHPNQSTIPKPSNQSTIFNLSDQSTLKIVPPPNGLYLGQNEFNIGDLSAFENAVGKKVALWSPYSVMSGVEEVDDSAVSFDAAAAQRAWDEGYIIMVGAYEATAQHKPFTVDNLLRGKYDTDLKRLAGQFRAFGKPMFFSTAREPNGVLADYMGGFGPDGNKSLDWALQNKKGFAEFNPSSFPNSQLYADLGDPNVCDGLERLAAAQRYYYDFFVRREKINFLTFDTMGWNAPLRETDEPKGSLLYNCFDFEQFYNGIKDYNDWISINWYMYNEDAEPPLQDYADALSNLMAKIRKVAKNKPILITELGFCGANRSAKVEKGLNEIMKYPEIKGVALWGSALDGWFFDCLTRANTSEANAFRRILGSNPAYFNSCAYFSDGTKIPNC